MFFHILMEADVINEEYAKVIAKFFGAHHAVQDSEPSDPTVRLLDIDDISGIDGTAMYLLFTWTKGLPQFTAQVKASHSNGMSVVIRSAATSVGTIEVQS